MPRIMPIAVGRLIYLNAAAGNKCYLHTDTPHTHTRNRNYLELDSVIASKLRALPAKT